MIDISALVECGNPDDVASAVAAIGTACRDVGFFYITGHGVPDTLVRQLQEQSHAFFALPEEEKMEISMAKGGRAWRGYFPVGSELTSGRPDMKEGLYFGSELGPEDPRVRAGTPLHGANLFPRLPPELQQLVLQYMACMEQLGHTLMAGISSSLELDPQHFRRHFMADPTCLFRIFNYPAGKLQAEDGQACWGVGEHTDYGLLTLLFQDTAGGLQVKNRANVWVEAPPLPATFIVNLGDMLEVMTAGLYRSTPHRARNTSGRPRLSFPFFFDPAWDARPTCVPLPPQLQLQALKARHADGAEGYRRWDGALLQRFRGTYGEHLVGKVAKVFPELAGQQLAVSSAGSLGSA